MATNILSDFMKGITPVIAIILLLMITISMVGFAFVWFSRISTTLGESAEKAATTQTGMFGKTIRIENIDEQAAATVISVRNTGTQTILSTETSVYIDNAKRTECALGDIATNSVVSCTAITACATDKIILVSAPGNSDQYKCK